MSGPLSMSLGSSSASSIIEKQGIVSILGSDTDQRQTGKGSSLRKTLSADMSSKKWLTVNGFSQLKKIASSEKIPVSITDSAFEEVGEDDCEDKKEVEKPCQFDIWSSIISKKDDDESSKSLPPPYVHPLVKRSSSCLSEKSLEICTESLGSETGSDGFSSYPPSETGEVEEDRKEEDQHGVLQLQQQKTACSDDEDEHPRFVKCNYDVIGKKSAQYGSFPPPIPSLSRKDGGSVRMETHRDNGRLVLEAVAVPSKNNFLAQRQDGRLVLTFSNTINETEDKGTETNTFGEEENKCREMEQGPKLESAAISVHRLAVLINKPIWLANRNPTWPKTFDEIVNLGEEKYEPTTQPPPSPPLQSLVLRPRVARLIPSPPPSTTTSCESFNAYEYYWRRPNHPMSSKAAILTPLSQPSPPSLLEENGYKQIIVPKKQTGNDQQQLLVLRGNNGDYFVPLLRGCKESRGSLVFSGPYCVATS